MALLGNSGGIPLIGSFESLLGFGGNSGGSSVGSSIGSELGDFWSSTLKPFLPFILIGGGGFLIWLYIIDTNAPDIIRSATPLVQSIARAVPPIIPV